MFRNLVLAFHNGKADIVNKVDSALEKELLSKEEYEAKYSAKRLDQNKFKTKGNSNHPNRQ